MLVMGMLLAATAPVRLEPAGKWVVDFGTNGCTVGRSYGSGNGSGEVTLAWRVLPIGNQAEMIVNRQARDEGMRRGVATVSLSPGSEQTVPFEAFSYGDAGIRRQRMFVDTPVFRNAAPDAILTITPSHGPALQMPVPELAKAWSVVSRCNDDMLRRWGIDPMELARIAVPARVVDGSAQWLRQSDYPAQAVLNGEVGKTSMLWIVGVDGRVESCRIVIRSGSPALDAAACDAMLRRVRYVPARDASGAPIRSAHVRSINWTLSSAWRDDEAYSRWEKEWRRAVREMEEADRKSS